MLAGGARLLKQVLAVRFRRERCLIRIEAPMRRTYLDSESWALSFALTHPLPLCILHEMAVAQFLHLGRAEDLNWSGIYLENLKVQTRPTVLGRAHALNKRAKRACGSDLNKRWINRFGFGLGQGETRSCQGQHHGA